MIGFCSEKVAEQLLVLVQVGTKETAILELEMVAVAVAIHLWQNRMASKRVIVFKDNDPVGSSIMRGYSQNTFVDCLMAHLFQVEEACASHVWLERVPSQSNPADEPSKAE